MRSLAERTHFCNVSLVQLRAPSKLGLEFLQRLCVILFDFFDYMSFNEVTGPVPDELYRADQQGCGYHSGATQLRYDFTYGHNQHLQIA